MKGNWNPWRKTTPEAGWGWLKLSDQPACILYTIAWKQFESNFQCPAFIVSCQTCYPQFFCHRILVLQTSVVLWMTVHIIEMRIWFVILISLLLFIWTSNIFLFLAKPGVSKICFTFSRHKNQRSKDLSHWTHFVGESYIAGEWHVVGNTAWTYM